jgi:hypothetical protein
VIGILRTLDTDEHPSPHPASASAYPLLLYQPLGFPDWHCYPAFFRENGLWPREKLWCAASSRTTVSTLNQSNSRRESPPACESRLLPDLLLVSCRPGTSNTAGRHFCRWRGRQSRGRVSSLIVNQHPRPLSDQGSRGVADWSILMLTTSQCRTTQERPSLDTEVA